MKSNGHEQAAWEAFQDRWKDASREAVLKRLFEAQHQATFYAHQIGAFPEAGQTVGGPACLCQAARFPRRPGGNFRPACPDVSAASPGRTDHPGASLIRIRRTRSRETRRKDHRRGRLDVKYSRLKAGSLWPDSTAIRRTFAGVPLWLRCPSHQGHLTTAPCVPRLAGQTTFAS